MLLTKQKLNNILECLRISIPAELEKELLNQYGNLAADDKGQVFEYTDQDICEQLRKKLSPYELHHLKGNPKLGTNFNNRAIFS
jgi:hypothetical protein